MLSYIVTRLFIESFRLMPFWVLYGVSDFSRFILFDLIGYRKKVIFENLEKAFPEKSKIEINEIARKFYTHFTDILFEGLKGMTMRDESVYKRFKVINPEVVDDYFKQGKSLLILGSHYGNWEWGNSIPHYVNHEVVCVYKTVPNKRLNEYMRGNRARLGMKQISLEKTRVIFNNITKPKFIILLADQSPSHTHKANWVNFLGRDTPCIHGPEAYGKIYNFPVFYIDFQRIKRGHYTAELSLIAEEPALLEKGELTQKYMDKLAQSIKLKPQNWLWSHKRWKHKREGDKLLTDFYYK
jgi:Kdo2-lipid IVA lauroyltransferase/acyltransferase